MRDSFCFLLLQVRNHDDPMREQEVNCFARALQCGRQQIRVHDLLRGAPSIAVLDGCQMVLLGGSGDYSVAEGGDWLGESLQAMRRLVELGKPTFASCWGFQAMALALGGQVITDLSRAELGTLPLRRTDEGRADPLFSTLSDPFLAQMGHQDVVDRLPPGVIRLAFTDKVANQAFRLQDKPVYCTQFHPELNRQNLLERVVAYPQYVERIAGVTYQQFVESCEDTPQTENLLRVFVKEYLEECDGGK